MHKVLVTDNILEQGLAPIYEHPSFIVERWTGTSQEELMERIGDFDVLIVRSQTQVTEELLARASKLRVIARAGVGVDNIDLQAATRKGIIVINAPGANTIAAAEHTFAMILAMARNIPQAHESMMRGCWDRSSFQGIELNKKTLGIIGMGKIGTEVAKRAKSFNMSILGYDPYLTEERAESLGIRKSSLDEIARESDFITLHTPLINSTRNLINEDYLKKTKNGVRIINCARGGIIDEKALLNAVNTGAVAGAALDVFAAEPPQDSTLLQHPQIIKTPHLAASTIEAQEKVAAEVSQEIIEILEHGSIHNAVNLNAISGEAQQRMQPFLQLGEWVGQLAIQLLKNAPDKINIHYSGNLLDEDTDFLSRTIIKGILSHHLTDSVNIINAYHLLKEQGIPYTVQKNSKNKGFSNYMELILQQKNETAVIGATVLDGYGARIVQLNHYPVDIRPEKYLLFIKHTDVPGMIGQVGSLLGNHQINIGTMQVGRADKGGDAIMVLTLDKKIDEKLLQQLPLIKGLKEAQMLELAVVSD
ncbi:phosphoglycerate dehydrogenase [Falsibacillus pallidus]|uniref:phosphoglycerate dehydrogenase n=1 Tax=Falsibacillus pallidus TaxID=493781 RepID=UPI003D993285